MHIEINWSRRGPASLLLPVAAGPAAPNGSQLRGIPRTVQGVLSNVAGRPNGVGLLGRKWTVGPFLTRFPGGALASDAVCLARGIVTERPRPGFPTLPGSAGLGERSE